MHSHQISPAGFIESKSIKDVKKFYSVDYYHMVFYEYVVNVATMNVLLPLAASAVDFVQVAAQSE